MLLALHFCFWRPRQRRWLAEDGQIEPREPGRWCLSALSSVALEDVARSRTYIKTSGSSQDLAPIFLKLPFIAPTVQTEISKQPIRFWSIHLRGFFDCIIAPCSIPEAVLTIYRYLEARKGAKSARSIGVVINNNTNRILIRQQIDLSHGEWTKEAEPPIGIPPKSARGFMVESHGFATGCEGFVIYYPQDYRRNELRIDFNNPYLGKNTHGTSTGGNARFHEVLQDKWAHKINENSKIVVDFSKYNPHLEIYARFTKL